MTFLNNLFRDTPMVSSQSDLTSSTDINLATLFTFNFTADKLAKCVNTKNPIGWFTALTQFLPRYGINTIPRVSAFLAQCGWESGDFKTLSENLNYGAPGLMATWPRTFPTLAIANQYARQPERIANRAYANRLGNGSEASGEGWKYRGRGLIQCTGKNNYSACSLFLYNDLRLVNDPDWLVTAEGAILSACWYWTANNINSPSDAKNIDEVTRRINPAMLHAAERRQRFQNCLTVLSK